MNHLKTYTELDNDEIVEYINSILMELNDLETASHEIIYFNKRGSMVYYVDNNLGTYRNSRKASQDCDKSLPIDRVDLLINRKNGNTFDYSDVKDVIEHINSYLWERGFGQDPSSSLYMTNRGVAHKYDKERVSNCILLDFDGLTKLGSLAVSFRKRR